MVEADNGFVGEGMHVRIRDEPNVSQIQFVAKARVLARHEAVNGRFKCFAILKLPFRHNLRLHGPVVRAIAVIINVAMSNGFPTFAVCYPAPGNV